VCRNDHGPRCRGGTPPGRATDVPPSSRSQPAGRPGRSGSPPPAAVPRAAAAAIPRPDRRVTRSHPAFTARLAAESAGACRPLAASREAPRPRGVRVMGGRRSASAGRGGRGAPRTSASPALPSHDPACRQRRQAAGGPALPPRRSGRRMKGRRRSTVNCSKSRHPQEWHGGTWCWAPGARGPRKAPSCVGKAATARGRAWAPCRAAPRPPPQPARPAGGCRARNAPLLPPLQQHLRRHARHQVPCCPPDPVGAAGSPAGVSGGVRGRRGC
jgi:hypothetical protein